MPPSLPLTIWATPGLPDPAWVSVGHCTVDPESSVPVVGAAALRYLVKFSVVPDESERWATVMPLDGSLASGFSVLIAASSHDLICRWKIFAMTSASSCSPSTPGRLYATVMGAATVGKYSRAPPLYLGKSAALGSPSDPARSTT